MTLLGRIKILAFVLAAALPAVLQAAPLPESAELLLRADKLAHNQADNVIEATGNVELSWSAAKLYADMATYYRGEDLVTATGGVRLEKDGDTLAGDSARLNITSRKGVIENGRLFVKKNNIHVTGKVIEKTGDQDYRIHDGSITSCDGERPGWQFRIDDLDVTLDEFAVGRNAYFYLGNLPVFWFPYLIFPVKTERQSGFLLPRLGHSSKKGFFLETPYYWDISPSRDATFALDLQSSRGVGAALEYRYKSRNNGEGTNRGYLIYDTSQSRFRGNLELQQQVNFSADTYWRADVNLVLDRDYFRDFGTVNGEYNRQYLLSTAFLSHRRDTMLVTGGADYFDNLEAADNSSTLHRLPFLTLMETGRRVGTTPLYYAYDAAVTRFDREDGSRGERFSLAPQLILQQTVYPGVSGRIWVGYNQRLYRTEAAAEGDGWQESGLLEGGGAVQAEFGRTFDFAWGSTNRLRHRIVPELGYSFSERRDQSQLPLFDYDDRPVGGEMLVASLHNYLTGKSVSGGVTTYRDLLKVTLRQGYQLSGQRRDLLVLVDDGRPLADTQLTAEVLPLPLLTLQSDLRISPYRGDLTNASVALEAGEHNGNRFGFSWHHARGVLDYLEGRVTLAALQPFTFSVLGRYSFDKPGLLETLYTAEYRQQCWSLLLSYRDRVDNKEFNFSFNLSGLGTFKLL